MTEFGAVEFNSRDTFHGVLVEAVPDPVNPAIPFIAEDAVRYDAEKVFRDFSDWANSFGGRPVFVSDNPAYDFMWIADGFDFAEIENPFGHSGRRIADLAAGLSGNWKDTQSWKRYRKTVHDHNPVNDSMGNCEAFEVLLEMYNQTKGIDNNG